MDDADGATRSNISAGQPATHRDTNAAPPYTDRDASAAQPGATRSFDLNCQKDRDALATDAREAETPEVFGAIIEGIIGRPISTQIHESVRQASEIGFD